jgi:D-amino peptidase
MKVFISADLEGCAGVSSRTQLYPTEREYDFARKQMTKEVLACCEGALAAGATEVFVRDAHGTARNLQLKDFPRQVRLFSDWAGSPWMMMEGLDSSFKATFFIGYHAASGSSGNPLAHTFSSEMLTKINGVPCSEFHVNAYASLYHNVPIYFVSGDENICSVANDWDTHIYTVTAQKGVGGGVISEHPDMVCEKIKEQSLISLKTIIEKQQMPKLFQFEFFFRKAKGAYMASFYPNARLKDENTVLFEAEDYLDCLKALHFISMLAYNLK